MAKAIWISSDNQLSVRSIEEIYKPQEAQVLVEVKFSGINPADIKHGIHLNLNNYPAGYEFAGTVVDAGPAAKFKIGDLVAGHNLPGRGKPIYHGAHQDLVIGEHKIFSPPKCMPLEDAACVSIMAQTAADALFNQLELPFSVLGDEEIKRPMLIWGGSTNVGVAAIQLANAAGLFPIFVTASTKHHATLRSLGATECFDYREPSVVEQIKSAVKNFGMPLKHIFDTIGSHGVRSSTDLCEGCCGNDTKLAVTLPIPGRPSWKMVLPTREGDFAIPTPTGSVRWMRGNLAWQSRIDRSFLWCLQNYGERFRVPNVRIVKGGENGIKAMKLVAAGKSSLEKVVIEHPL